MTASVGDQWFYTDVQEVFFFLTRKIHNSFFIMKDFLVDNYKL